MFLRYRIYSPKDGTLFGLPMLYWCLWIAILILWMGRFVTPFLSMYLVSDMHVSAGVAGTVVSMYGFGGILASLFGGILSDRFGRRVMIIVGEVSAAVLLVVLAHVSSVAVMSVVLFVYGALSSLAGPSISAYIADIVPVAHRQRAYTLQIWAMNFGFTIGPIVANQLVVISYHLIFYVEAAVLLLVVALLLVVFRNVRNGRKPDVYENKFSFAANYRRTLTDVPFVMFVVLMIGYTLAYFQNTSGLPISMGELGLGTPEYSLLLSINGAILCVLQIPAIRLFERMGNSMVLVMGLALTAVGFGIQIFATSWTGFAVATVLWSLGELGTFPIASTTVSGLAPSDCRGTYQGIYNLTWSLSHGLAPLLGGLVISAFGGQRLWIICTVLLAAVTVGLWLSKGGRERAVSDNLRREQLRTLR